MGVSRAGAGGTGRAGTAGACKTGEKKANERKAGDKKAKGGLVLQRGTARGVQQRRAGKGAWTAKRKATFLDHLQASCNVCEAARQAGVTPSRAYELRRRDPAFAAQWAGALEQGYAELEMLLLRQSIHGSETTETIDEGREEGARRTKRVHSYPHSIGLRLLLAHKGTVDAFREEKGRQLREGLPGSADVRSEIQRRIAALRCEEDEGGGEEGTVEDAGGETLA